MVIQLYFSIFLSAVNAARRISQIIGGYIVHVHRTNLHTRLLLFLVKTLGRRWLEIIIVLCTLPKTGNLMIFIFTELLKQFFDFFMSLSKSFKRKIMCSQLLYSLVITHWMIWIGCGYFIRFLLISKLWLKEFVFFFF